MNNTNGSFVENQKTQPAASSAHDQLESASNEPSPPSERILVTCPSCKTTLSVRRVYVGNGVCCKRCEQKFVVPTMAGAQAMPIYDGVNPLTPSDSTPPDANPHGLAPHTGR